MEKYIKVVYQSEPIGPEKIILYLTTFDFDKFNNKLEKKKFGIETYIDTNMPKRMNQDINEFLEQVEVRLNSYVKNFYEPYINELQEYLKNRNYDNLNHIANVDKVYCNNVNNITNCDVVYCNVIKGKVVNCDKIVFKKNNDEERIISL